MFEEIEINDDMKSNLDAFLPSAIIGKKVDFISRQRENPNPAESYCVSPKSLTDDQALEVLKKMNQRIWGNDA